jgi:hypothetical protein
MKSILVLRVLAVLVICGCTSGQAHAADPKAPDGDLGAPVGPPIHALLRTPVLT